MPTKNEIDTKYLDQANILETEFFGIVDEGLPTQHRLLKSGKLETDFSSQQGVIWQNHEAELILNGFLLPKVEPEPPRSSHISTLESVDPTKARPARIKRVWQGKDYYYDCFATQTVRDEYVAGKVAVGDYMIVHFDEVGEQIVTAKVWKSW